MSRSRLRTPSPAGAVASGGSAGAEQVLDHDGALRPARRARRLQTSPDIYEWIAGAEEDGSVRQLSAALDHVDGRVREAAVGALGRLGDPQAAGAVSRALADQDPFVRAAAVVAIPRLLALRPAVARLTDALADEDELVRARAAGTLGDLGHADAIEPLVELIEREPPRSVSRQAAAEALSGLGTVEKGHPLTSPLFFWVTGAALFALGVVMASVWNLGPSAAAVGITGAILLVAFRVQSIRRSAQQHVSIADECGSDVGPVWVGAALGGGLGCGGGGGGDGGGGGGGC